jgi:hypothetical protein
MESTVSDFSVGEVQQMSFGETGKLGYGFIIEGPRVRPIASFTFETQDGAKIARATMISVVAAAIDIRMF